MGESRRRLGGDGWGQLSLTHLQRNVRGSLFADYVRMIRRRKDVDWERILPKQEVAYLREHIEPNQWYPMESFERLGLAILDHLEVKSMDAVRFWGRLSADEFSGASTNLIVPGEPVESLMRLRVMRNTLFDFPAFDLPMLTDGHAYIEITYHMSPRAEEAACHQTLGFCEGVVSLASATPVRAMFRERAWRGAARTLIDLEWTPST